MKQLKKYSIVLLILALVASCFIQTEVFAANKTNSSASEQAAKKLSKKQIKFINSRIKWAICLNDEAKREHGVELSTVSIIAQAAKETGWGKSDFCKKYNNDFGIKDFRTNKEGEPRYFDSHFASWTYYYVIILTDERYADALDATNTYDYIGALVEGGYCPDYGYQSETVQIANRIKPYVQAKEAEIRAMEEAVCEKTVAPKDTQKVLIKQLDRLSRKNGKIVGTRTQLLRQLDKLAQKRKIEYNKKTRPQLRPLFYKLSLINCSYSGIFSSKIFLKSCFSPSPFSLSASQRLAR